MVKLFKVKRVAWPGQVDFTSISDEKEYQCVCTKFANSWVYAAQQIKCGYEL